MAAGYEHAYATLLRQLHAGRDVLLDGLTTVTTPQPDAAVPDPIVDPTDSGG
jgi:hypothetical protein